MISCVVLFTTIIASVSSVAAHGYVKEVVIGGKTLSGFLPFVDPYANPIPARVIRNIPGDGPIDSLTSPDLVCNKGGTKGASLVADAPAGSKVTFRWTNWPDDHRGPVTTWMTSCGGSCKNFDPTKAKFFKIDEAGYQNGQWASQKLIQQGNSWTVTIPSSLGSGEYLIRHEIMAMHAAPAQMYPSCTQVRVTGGGSTEPATKDAMTITDAYRSFKEPDIWADGFKSFSIQGPPVARFAAGNVNSTASPTSPADDNHNDNASSVSSTPSSSRASAPPNSTAQPTSIPVKSPPPPSVTHHCRARKTRRRRHHAKRMHSH
jgi:hypothetical protein